MDIDKIIIGSRMRKKMRNKKIVIATLCIAVCIMAVGFAAFSTQLTINGTANISSTWKVVFSNIEEVSKTSGVKINNAAQASGTTATFDVGLASPGDQIVYKITVANQGTLDAIVNGIAVSDTGSDAIIFEVDGIEEGDELAKQSTTTFNVTIKYDESVTGQPSVLENTLTVNINYVQDLGQVPAINNPNVVTDSFAARILNDNFVQNDSMIDLSSTTSIYTGLYYTNKNTEDNKTTYYFKGNVKNNYVKFAKDLTTGEDIIWRIVRINEDGSVRLVTENSIGVSQFNTSYNDNAYVGYMYGTPNSTTYELTHKNENDSEVKKILDDWYTANLASYGNLMSTSAGFCNDRSIAPSEGLWFEDDTALGYGQNKTYYGSANRIGDMYNALPTIPKPNFQCLNKDDDLFTVTDASIGNNALDNPVGLLTIDEVVYSLGAWISPYNSTYSSYLMKFGKSYLTMSPYQATATGASLYQVYNSNIYSGAMTNKPQIHPVINVNFTSSNILGNGSSGTPYVIG